MAFSISVLAAVSELRFIQPEAKKRHLYFCWLLAICMSLLGCVSHSGRSDGWTQKQVVGLTISLNDSVKEEWYSFHAGGVVSATFGEKKGGISFPLYYWRIRNGVLQVLDDEKRVFQELRLVKRTGQSITAMDKTGKTIQFTILRESSTRPSAEDATDGTSETRA